MKVLIVYATRYGSTRDVAELIAKYLNKFLDAEVCDVSKACLKGADAVLLGSGIYANKMLPQMEDFIKANISELNMMTVGLFGVAMRTEPVEKNGRRSGGIYIFDRYPLEPFARGMLHGRRDFDTMTDEDKTSLERFYKAIGLSEEEKNERKKFCDRVSESECTAFAKEVLKKISPSF